MYRLLEVLQMADNGHIVKSFFKQVNKSVENKTNTMTQIKSAMVHSVNVDGTVNITIPPSETVYHNIQNQSIYRNLRPGDNVKIIKEGNSLSNMWIMGGFGLEPRTEITSDQTSLWQGDFSKTFATIESTAKANSAKIKSLASWQSQVYNDVANISRIEQTANSNEASIDLVVESTDVGKRIRSAEIMMSINNDESETTIRADKIKFQASDFDVISEGINLSGYVTFDHLKENGTTEINGSNIKTGLIQSANYIANTSGTSINLTDGVIDNKYFKLNSDGGSFSNCIIGNTCTVNGQINVNNGVFKVNNDGGMIATSAQISGDSRIGDDNLYINIGASSSGDQYNSFYLRGKDGDSIINKMEIWYTSNGRAFVGGNTGISLGIIGNNTSVMDIASDQVIIGQPLYTQNITSANIDCYDLDANDIVAYDILVRNGHTIMSDDGVEKGKIYISDTNSLCIQDCYPYSNSSGFFLVDRSNNSYLGHKYNQLISGTSRGNITMMYGKWRATDTIGSENGFALEVPNLDGSQVLSYGNLLRDDGYYLSLDAVGNSSGLRLKRDGTTALQVTGSAGSTYGTLYGSWGFNQDQKWNVVINTNSSFIVRSKEDSQMRLHLWSSGDNSCIHAKKSDNDTSGNGFLGGANWYVNSAPIATTSDRNSKNTIISITSHEKVSQYESVFNSLQPVTYKYNTDDVNVHTGFIAQDIEESIINAGMNNSDFGAVTYGSITHENGTVEEHYYLRYEEIIALNTWQIQKLKTKVSELELRIAALEQK